MHQPCTVTLRNYKKDGTLFWNEISINPLFDSSGALTHYTGILHDVTERKQIESFQGILFHIYQSSAIAQTLEDFLYLFNQPMDHAIPGKELFMATFDPTTQRYTVPGFEPQGDPFWNWEGVRLQKTLVDYVRRHGKPFIATRETQKQLAIHGEIILSDKMPHIWLGVPIIHHETLYGVLIVQNTKLPLLFATQNLPLIHTAAEHLAVAVRQKVAHEELELARQTAEGAVQAKSVFLANMSHEFRTPLNSIIGFSDLLLQPGMDALTERQQSYMRTVSKSGKHLLTLINTILDLAKLESGKTSLEMRELSLSALVKEACDIVRADLDKKHLSVVIDIDPQIRVMADRRALLQILLNLLANAIKFTPENGKIGVTATPQETEVAICVWDTGIGIAPEDCERIFDSFQQADNSFTRQYQGTGLGLTISKSLVELQGGMICVKSKVGEGSKFIFTLRTPIQEQIGDETPQNKPTTANTSQTTLTVLVIDDEPLNRMLSREVLERAGWQVFEACDGAEGVRFTETKNPDVILCDIQMPVMDGIAVLQELRLHSEHVEKTIIALTAYAMTGDAEALLEKGFDGYLSKPINIPTFVDDIKKIHHQRLSSLTRSSKQLQNV
jgi:signal transduction histidine kinase/CheY-like chemotaxis protein